MTSPHDHTRVPAGVPSGGQFAASARAEADVALGDESPRDALTREEMATWGETSTALRRLDNYDDEVTLPDGARATIDVRVEVGGIAEDADYLVAHADGTTSVHPFNGLDQRATVADGIAREAVLRGRGLDSKACKNCAQSIEADDEDGWVHSADGVAGCGAPFEDAERYAEPDDDDDDDDFWAGAEIIHAYSRADALRDGALVDHSKMALEAGFKYPLALTAAAQADAVTWTRHAGLQDEEGRAWDVLMMAGFAARRPPAPGEHPQRRTFSVMRVPNEGRGHAARETTLVLHIGPGDTPEPVMTIMCPNED